MRQKLNKVKEFVIKNLEWIILFVCVIIFLEITLDVFQKEIMTKDILGYKFISTYLISDTITPIAKITTQMGGAIALIGITIVLLLFLKNKKIGIAIAINLGIATSLNLLLKQIVQRPRPTASRMINETGYSFPSGHSMISMAFYGFLIYLIYNKVENKKIKMGLIITLSILIVMIGISRIYLGVHYTSDVLAGFTISLSYLIIYTRIIKKIILEKEEREEENEKINK